MNFFLIPVQVRWADLDPNFHLRHSVYYDWGATCRMAFLYANGLTAALMQQLHFGPIIFREECVFKKEVRAEDTLTIDINLLEPRKDFSRWTIQHQIKKSDGQVSAVLTIDGAWMNTLTRKLTVPPAEAIDVFLKMPLAEDFRWIEYFFCKTDLFQRDYFFRIPGCIAVHNIADEAIFFIGNKHFF